MKNRSRTKVLARAEKRLASLRVPAVKDEFHDQYLIMIVGRCGVSPPCKCLPASHRPIVASVKVQRARHCAMLQLMDDSISD